MWTVYKHTSPNGKVYIGITSKNPEKRWNNGTGYKTNTYFWNAIQKYGWDNFKHEIIATDLPSEAAYELEIKLIAEHDSTNPTKGYNHSTGGEVITKGVVPSEECRKKISDKLTGRTLSEQTKEKLKIAQKGIRGDRVQCVETGKIYVNAQAAQDDTGVYFKSIQRAALGYYQTAGKLHWKFVDVDKKMVFDSNYKTYKTATFE